MTDLLEDLKAYFVANGTVSNLIFRDSIPNAPDNAIALYEYQGSNPLPQIASSTRSVQVVVRDKHATDAKVKARELYKLLESEDGIVNLTLERWSVIQLLQVPFKIKVDEAGRIYYGFNMTVTTYND